MSESFEQAKITTTAVLNLQDPRLWPEWSTSLNRQAGHTDLMSQQRRPGTWKDQIGSQPNVFLLSKWNYPCT